MSDDLLHEVKGRTAHITFNRPAQRNALTFEMYEQLAAICDDPGDVRAIVISGAGGAFAAGTDMTQFRAFDKPEDGWAYEENMDAIMGRIERAPVPTIAAITGACTGGGAAIAACCDLRIGARDMRFGFPIARTLGNCLAAGNLARLSELIGAARVREIIFTARLIEADEALSIGLVSEVLPDEASLMARASELAAKVGSMAPLTLHATKEALRRNRAATKVDDSDLIISCYMSEDFRSGMEAFLAKQKPEWKGK